MSDPESSLIFLMQRCVSQTTVELADDALLDQVEQLQLMYDERNSHNTTLKKGTFAKTWEYMNSVQSQFNDEVDAVDSLGTKVDPLPASAFDVPLMIDVRAFLPGNQDKVLRLAQTTTVAELTDAIKQKAMNSGNTTVLRASRLNFFIKGTTNNLLETGESLSCTLYPPIFPPPHTDNEVDQNSLTSHTQDICSDFGEGEMFKTSLEIEVIAQEASRPDQPSLCSASSFTEVRLSQFDRMLDGWGVEDKHRAEFRGLSSSQLDSMKNIEWERQARPIQELKVTVRPNEAKGSDQPSTPLYLVYVRAPDREWIVTKKFRDFYSLKTSLQAACDGIDFPKRTSKALSAYEIKMRAGKLERFLEDVLAQDCLTDEMTSNMMKFLEVRGEAIGEGEQSRERGNAMTVKQARSPKNSVGTTVVAEGMLAKRAIRRGRNYRWRYVVLDSNGEIRYYVKAPKDGDLHKGSFSLTSEFYVADCPLRVHGFHMSDLTNTYHLAASSLEDKLFWMHCIRGVIERLAVVNVSASLDKAVFTKPSSVSSRESGSTGRSTVSLDPEPPQATPTPPPEAQTRNTSSSILSSKLSSFLSREEPIDFEKVLTPRVPRCESVEDMCGVSKLELKQANDRASQRARESLLLVGELSQEGVSSQINNWEAKTNPGGLARKPTPDFEADTAKLLELIQSRAKEKNGQKVISFGDLFVLSPQLLVGRLRLLRRRGELSYDGDMLWFGIHDNVQIVLRDKGNVQ